MELDLLKAVYAYEEGLSERKGRRTCAARTWQMIRRHGIIKAAERAVDRPIETAGYKVLVEMGLQEFTFESVIVRYPSEFSEDAVARSKARLEEMADV